MANVDQLGDLMLLEKRNELIKGSGRVPHSEEPVQGLLNVLIHGAQEVDIDPLLLSKNA